RFRRGVFWRVGEILSRSPGKVKALCRKFTFQELDSLFSNLIRVLEEPPPDRRGGRDLGHRLTEALDRAPAPVLQVPERTERALPVHLPRARHAAVALRDVHVREMLAARLA